MLLSITLGCLLGILALVLSPFLCPEEPQSCWPASPGPLTFPSWAGGQGEEPPPLLAPEDAGKRQNQEEESVKKKVRPDREGFNLGCPHTPGTGFTRRPGGGEGGRKLAEQEEAQGRGAELRTVRGSWWEKWGEADSGALDV